MNTIATLVVSIVLIVILVGFILFFNLKREASTDNDLNVRRLSKKEIKQACEQIRKLDPEYQPIYDKWGDTEELARDSIEIDDESACRCSLDVEKFESELSRKDIDVTNSMEFLEWEFNHKEPTFQQLLLKMIEEKQLTNTEFYKAAWIDRKLFSAIKNNENYQPKKETVVACCLGLKAHKTEAWMLMDAAGYSLSMSIGWDRVVSYCLENGIFEIENVNQLLYAMGEKCIGE